MVWVLSRTSVSNTCVRLADNESCGDNNIITNMSELYLNGVTVNSTANARRIADVEQCFGGAGQPLAVPGKSSQSHSRILMSGSRSGPSGRGSPHKSLQEETQASPVLSLQRHPRVREYHHQQEEIHYSAHHPTRGNQLSSPRLRLTD